MTSKATTISQYLKELPPDRRTALAQLRSLINKIAPKAVEGMKYGLPAFGDVCALASQKHYMALYVCDPEAVGAYRQQLGKLNCGKGCIRFKRIEELPIDVIANILKDAVKRHGTGLKIQ